MLAFGDRKAGIVGNQENLRAELDAAFKQLQSATAELRALGGGLASVDKGRVKVAGLRCKELTERYLEVLRRYNNFLEHAELIHTHQI